MEVGRLQPCISLSWISHYFCKLAQANAQKIAEYLSNHPRVERVNYAGLPGHSGHNLHFSQVHQRDCEQIRFVCLLFL
jgi:hypothetical protein